MQVTTTNNTRNLKINSNFQTLLSKAADLSGLTAKVKSENLPQNAIVSLVFVGRQRIRYLKNLFFGEDRITDVIAFDLTEDAEDEKELEEDESPVVAEIYVCPEVAARYAPKFDNSVPEEIVCYVVHGMLHLTGYDDLASDNRKAMQETQQTVMGKLTAEISSSACLTYSGENR